MKHSHTRPAEFCRIFTLSLAAAAAVFALGWLLISRPSGPPAQPPAPARPPGVTPRRNLLTRRPRRPPR